MNPRETRPWSEQEKAKIRAALPAAIAGFEPAACPIDGATLRTHPPGPVYSDGPRIADVSCPECGRSATFSGV